MAADLRSASEGNKPAAKKTRTGPCIKCTEKKTKSVVSTRCLKVEGDNEPIYNI